MLVDVCQHANTATTFCWVAPYTDEVANATDVPLSKTQLVPARVTASRSRAATLAAASAVAGEAGAEFVAALLGSTSISTGGGGRSLAPVGARGMNAAGWVRARACGPSLVERVACEKQPANQSGASCTLPPFTPRADTMH